MLESKIRTPPPAFFAVFYSFAYPFPIALTSIAIRKFSVSPLPHLNRDIQALASLKKSILKQREWELQHGDLIRSEHEINMEKNIKKRFNKLLDYLGDDGQKRLICMTNQFLEMAEKIAVPGEINAEGKLVLVDDNN